MSLKACIIGRIDGRGDHSDKICCCGGHNWHNKKKDKKHHGTMVKLLRRKIRRAQKRLERSES